MGGPFKNFKTTHHPQAVLHLTRRWRFTRRNYLETKGRSRTKKWNTHDMYPFKSSLPRYP